VTIVYIDKAYGDEEKTYGTYVYDPPVVMITVDGETVSGEISGNKLILTGEDGLSLVFTRQ
jgi:hypothetical protein